MAAEEGAAGTGEETRSRGFTEEDLEKKKEVLKTVAIRMADPLESEKPDESSLEVAKRKLSRCSTADKNRLPTADDIKVELAGEAVVAAEEKLKEGRDKLKAPESGTQERQRLPTVDDINAENCAKVEAEEVLRSTKRLLSGVKGPPVEKQTLPTAADIDTEKKDKSCAVVGSEQMAKAKQSQAKADAAGMHMGKVDVSGGHGAGAGGGLGLNAPGHNVKVQHFAGGGSGVAAKKQVNMSPEIDAAWQQVLDDSSKTTWLYCKYSEDLKTLDLQASGEGGLSDFKKQVGDQMAWGAFRCYGVDKRGGTEVRRTKFVFVQVRPEGVSTMKKAKQASHKANVKEVIGNTHIDVSIDTAADLDEQSLIKTLQSATGAHKPNGYEFDPGAFHEADYYGLDW